MVPALNLWEWSVPNTTAWEIQMNLANLGFHGLLFTQNTGKEKGQPEWGGVGFFLIWTEMHYKDEVSFFFFVFFNQKNRLWPGGNPVTHEKVHKTRTRSTFLTCLSTPIRPIITKPVIKLGKGNHTMWLTVSGIFQFLSREITMCLKIFWGEIYQQNYSVWIIITVLLTVTL